MYDSKIKLKKGIATSFSFIPLVSFYLCLFLSLSHYWLWGSQLPCQEDTQVTLKGPRDEEQKPPVNSPRKLKPSADKNMSELKRRIYSPVKPWNASLTLCTLVRDPELLTMVIRESLSTKPITIFQFLLYLTLGYRTTLNKYMIVYIYTEWNFLRKVTLLRLHTNVNFCLKIVFWWETWISSQSHNH